MKSPLTEKTLMQVKIEVRRRWGLNLQYFGHLMGRANSLEKTLTVGKIEDRRR